MLDETRNAMYVFFAPPRPVEAGVLRTLLENDADPDLFPDSIDRVLETLQRAPYSNLFESLSVNRSEESRE